MTSEQWAALHEALQEMDTMPQIIAAGADGQPCAIVGGSMLTILSVQSMGEGQDVVSYLNVEYGSPLAKELMRALQRGDDEQR